MPPLFPYDVRRTPLIAGFPYLLPGSDAFKHWTTNDIPDLTGRTALVTGANSGLGFETCRRLANNNAKVLMVVRDRTRGERAANDIRQEYKRAQVQVLVYDLSSLKNVQALIHDVNRRNEPLHILVNNAGLFLPGPFMLTQDGLEQQLAVNYYSHVLLTLGLLDKLVASKPSRIIWNASMAETYGIVDWSNLKGDKYSGSGIYEYGDSKLFMIMFAKELRRRLEAMPEGKDVDVFAVHPGLSLTRLLDKVDLKDYWYAWYVYANAKTWGQKPATGSYSIVRAATDPELQGSSFKYLGPNQFNFFNQAYRPPGNLWAHNEAACKRMFDDSIKVLEDVLGANKVPKPHKAHVL